MGTTHPCLLTSAGCPAEIFFGWPLTKAFGEDRSVTLFPRSLLHFYWDL